MLKLNKKFRTNLHDEANDTTDEEKEIIMPAWHFYANISEVDTPPEWIYNADQTGLYYQNFPNHVYVDEANKKDYYGLKQMKDKTRIRLVPAQDVPFFYTRSHLSALQNCALLLSTNFQFIFIFKKCTTQFSHWIM